MSLEELLSVEVESVFGASKFLQKITEAPAAVTVVTSTEIARYGWRTLADVLRSVRGFYVADDRSWAYAGVRGFLRPGDYNTRLLLLVDGTRINDNVYDQAFLQDDVAVHLEDVERIEIVRGPSSSLYGSNAFFGVVNIVTKSASDVRGVRVTADAGSLGLWTGRVSIGREFANGLSLTASSTATSQDGVEQLYYPEFDDASTNFGIASGLDHLRHRNALVSAKFRGFLARAGYNFRQKGIPTGAYGTVFNDPNTQVQDAHVFVHSGWDGALSSAWQGRLRATFDSYGYSGTYPYDWDADSDTPTVNYIDVGEGHWFGVEGLATRQFGTRHRLTIGGEHRANARLFQEGYLEDPYETQWGDRRSSSTSAIFVQDEFRVLPRLLVSAGLRYDRYSAFRDPVTPRLATILDAGPRTTVKFIYGQAFRAPNVFESFYVTPGFYKSNPMLEPERIRTLEAVVEHYVGRRLRVSASTFANDVSRLIALTSDPADGLLYYANLDQAKAYGVEGEAEAKWPSGTQLKGSYSYTRAHGVEASNSLPNSPRHLAQALVSFPVGRGAFLGVDARALGSRLTVTGQTVSSHVVPNLTLSGAAFGGRLRYGLTASNASNTRYADPVSDEFSQPSIPQNGRTVRVRLTWAF